MVPTILRAQIAIIIGKHLEQQDLACLQTQGRCYDKVKHVYLNTFLYIYRFTDTHTHKTSCCLCLLI